MQKTSIHSTLNTLIKKKKKHNHPQNCIKIFHQD